MQPVLSFRFAIVFLKFDFSVGNHLLKPELKRFNRYGYLFQFGLNTRKINHFIFRNLSVRRYLNQPFLLFLHCVERCKHFKHNSRQILDLYLRNILLPDGTLVRTVIIAQIRVPVPAGHFKHFVRTRHKSPVFNSFNAIRRNPAQHFARLFPRIAHVFTANLILSFIILVRCSPHFFVPPVFFILRMLLRNNFVKQRRLQNLSP